MNILDNVFEEYTVLSLCKTHSSSFQKENKPQERKDGGSTHSLSTAEANIYNIQYLKTRRILNSCF